MVALKDSMLEFVLVYPGKFWNIYKRLKGAESEAKLLPLEKFICVEIANSLCYKVKYFKKYSIFIYYFIFCRSNFILFLSFLILLLFFSICGRIACLKNVN